MTGRRARLPARRRSTHYGRLRLARRPLPSLSIGLRSKQPATSDLPLPLQRYRRLIAREPCSATLQGRSTRLVAVLLQDGQASATDGTAEERTAMVEKRAVSLRQACGLTTKSSLFVLNVSDPALKGIVIRCALVVAARPRRICACPRNPVVLRVRCRRVCSRDKSLLLFWGFTDWKRHWWTSRGYTTMERSPAFDNAWIS